MVDTPKQDYGEGYKSARCILQLNDEFEIIAEYTSINAAARAVGISNFPIRAVLKGKYDRAGRYRWSYIIESVNTVKAAENTAEYNALTK